MSSLNRDVAVNAASNIALAVLGVASGSLISYRFGAEGRGVIGAAQVIAALSAALGSLGLGDAFLYMFASGREIRRSTVLLASALASTSGAALGAGLGGLLMAHLDVGAHSPNFVLFCGLVSAATAFYTIPNGVLRGIGGFFSWNVLRLTATVAWIIALIVGGVGGTIRLSVIASVYTVILLLASGFALAHCRGHFTLELRYEREPVVMKQLLRFGLPAALASAPLLLNARIDQVALAFSNSAVTVGHYAAAAGYCWATVPFGQAIANLMVRRVASEPTRESRVATLRVLTGLGVAVIGVSALLAALAAPLALRLLNGPGFGPSVTIARILLVGTAFQGVTTLLEEGAKGLGHPRLAMLAELSGLAVMGLLLVLLTRRGSAPTAIASSAGYLASFIVITRGVSATTAVRVRQLLRPATLGEARSAFTRVNGS